MVAQPLPNRIAEIREMVVIVREHLFGLRMVLPPEYRGERMSFIVQGPLM